MTLSDELREKERRRQWGLFRTVGCAMLVMALVAGFVGHARWQQNKRNPAARMAGQLCALQGVSYTDCRKICDDIWRQNNWACRAGAAEKIVGYK